MVIYLNAWVYTKSVSLYNADACFLCSAFLYDSAANEGVGSNESRSEVITQSLLEFVRKEEEAVKANAVVDSLKVQYSNFSGALAMALCCIIPYFAKV